MAPRSPPDFWATLPPHHWARARMRAQVVARYLELPNPTQEIAQRYASELGINIRTFYRLIASFKAAKAALGRPSRQGLSSPLEPCTAAMLDAVIAELGPGTSDSEVLAQCRIRCAALSLKAPSLSAVRTRTGKRRVSKHLAERLHLSADLICDTCPLLLDIGDRGIAQPARLTGLIDVTTGNLLTYRVHSDDPTPELLTELAKAGIEGRHLQPANKGRNRLYLAVTRPLAGAAIEATSDLESLGFTLALPSRSIRGGNALIAVLGRRIGRIAFAPLRRKGTVAPSLPIDEAQEVVAYLLAQMNAGVGSAS